MRTWCVSLTMSGTSKLIIHDFYQPCVCTGSGKHLREQHISAQPVPYNPWLGGWPNLRLLPFPDLQVCIKKLELTRISRSQPCKLISCKWRVMSQKKKKKMSPTWIPKHFQHQTWKHWWMRKKKITKAVYLYIALHNMFVGTESLFKGHARERDHVLRSFTYSDMVLRRIKLLLFPLKITKKYFKLL